MSSRVSFALLLILALHFGTTTAGVSDSTFAFVEAKNVQTGNSAKLCVNYQQFSSKRLPYSPDVADPLRLSWFYTKPNVTELCLSSTTYAPLNASVSVVPARYRQPSQSQCYFTLNTTGQSLMNAQAKYLKQHDVDTVIYLAKKGEKISQTNFSFYLFSDFYDPTLSVQHPTTFYMYVDDFYNRILSLADGGNVGDVELRFYHPKSWPFDFAEVVTLAIAIFCILVGSLWTATEFRLKKNEATMLLPVASSAASSESPTATTTATATDDDADNPAGNSDERTKPTGEHKSTFKEQLISIMIAVPLVVGILLVAYFFRDKAIIVFNIFVTIVGSFSIHACIWVCVKRPFARATVYRGKFNIASFFFFLFAAAFCVIWYIHKSDYWSFILLNIINICISIHAIYLANIRQLRLLVIFLIAMFVYDIFMVYGTKLLTPDGCSVMVQVATGMDCSRGHSADVGFFVAPVEAPPPERMPMLFYIPVLNDVMHACYDLAIELEYPRMMLGLGDVILPGYLVAYGFVFDQAKGNRYLLGFGPITLIGYSAGLITTFASLRLMQVAQPALIYLVPFTVIPLTIAGYLRGCLSELWYGHVY